MPTPAGKFVFERIARLMAEQQVSQRWPGSRREMVGNQRCVLPFLFWEMLAYGKMGLT
jgi:hypothetical protein